MTPEQPRRPIALFVPSLNGGGAERVFVTLANEFSRLVACPVHLVLARGGGCFMEEVDPRVQVIDLNQVSVLKSLLPLAAYLKHSTPQVLLATMWEANLVALMARRLARSDLRVVIREANVFRTDRARQIGRLAHLVSHQLMRHLYPRADATVIIASDVLLSLEAAGIRVSRERAFIGNPVRVATHEKPSALPAVLNGVVARPFVCAMGRLVEQKGFDLLLQAMSSLGPVAPDLVILGEGRGRAALAAQARRLGIADKVHLPGFVAAPDAVLRQARLFVSSSRWEGFPNAIMDALAEGVPVVATRCPGASADILEQGRYGHLVAPESATALAEGIRLGLSQPAATPSQRRSRSREFLPDVIARRYLHEVMRIDPDEVAHSEPVREVTA